MNATALAWINPTYTITDTGKVHGRGGRCLSQHKNTNGYAQVALICSDGKRRQFLVARLVLQAFSKVVGINGLQANHKNGVRDDNRLTNLEWVSASENSLHAYRVLGREHSRPALGKFGAANPSSKGVQQYTKCGLLVKEWGAIRDTANEGFNPGNVSAVCRGVRHTHAGFFWKFI